MIGIIGIGSMGGAIANCFARNFLDVEVFDIEPARVEERVAAGCHPSASVEQIMAECDPVLTSLPKSGVFVDVADRSIVPNARNGQTIIDLGTTVVAEARRVHRLLKERNAEFLDAPVSGGRLGCAKGSLYTFVGGDRDVAMAQWPLLTRISKSRLTYCGPSGAGQITKAVNQLSMGLVSAAFTEAIAFGVRAGVNAEVLLNAVGGGGGFRDQFAHIASTVVAGEGDSMDNKHAELEYFLDEADNVGFPAPLMRAYREWIKQFPETHGDNMGRPYAPFWSSLVDGDLGGPST